MGIGIGAGLIYAFFMPIPEKKPCKEAPFVFMRMYGGVQENQWERLNDSYPSIEDNDIFRLLIKRGDYFEVIVPQAIPVTWEGDAFVYRGVWPVKNR